MMIRGGAHGCTFKRISSTDRGGTHHSKTRHDATHVPHHRFQHPVLSIHPRWTTNPQYRPMAKARSSSKGAGAPTLNWAASALLSRVPLPSACSDALAGHLGWTPLPSLPLPSIHPSTHPPIHPSIHPSPPPPLPHLTARTSNMPLRSSTAQPSRLLGRGCTCSRVVVVVVGFWWLEVSGVKSVGGGWGR